MQEEPSTPPDFHVHATVIDTSRINAKVIDFSTIRLTQQDIDKSLRESGLDVLFAHPELLGGRPSRKKLIWRWLDKITQLIAR